MRRSFFVNHGFCLNKLMMFIIISVLSASAAGDLRADSKDEKDDIGRKEGDGGAKEKKKILWSVFKVEGMGRGLEGKFFKTVANEARSKGIKIIDGRNRKTSKCETKKCRLDKIKKAKTELLLEMELELIGETYIAEIVLSSPSKGLIWNTKTNCEICTIEEARKWLAKSVGGLFQKTVKGLKKPSLGKEESSQKGGSEGGKKEEDIGGGKTKQTSEVDLHHKTTVEKSTPKKKDRKKVVLKGMGWILGGASLLGFVPGAVLLAIDGKGTCSKSEGECPNVYDTKLGGIVSLAIGGACLVTAVTLYVLGALRKDQEVEGANLLDEGYGIRTGRVSWVPAISPVSGGTTVSVSGRF